MGKKKAKKRSKLLDAGKNSVNIELSNGKAEKYRKHRRLGRTEAQTRIILFFLAGIIVLLLLAILWLMRQQAQITYELMNLIEGQRIGPDAAVATPATIAIQIFDKI